jgi:hypothetical protein
MTIQGNQEALTAERTLPARTASAAPVIIFPKVSARPIPDGNFDYRFIEAGIETGDGNRAGYFDGIAGIEWIENPEAYGGYEWWVEDIHVDTRHGPEKLNRNDWLYTKLVNDLEAHFKDEIDARVEESR